MPTVLVYLVVAGAKSAGDEEVFRRAVDLHLAALDEALRGVEVLTATTGKSVVGIQLLAEGRRATDAAKNIRLYFAGLGVRSIGELPTKPLRSGATGNFGTLPAPRRIASRPSAPDGGLFIEELLTVIAEHGAMRPQDLADRLRHPVEEVETVLANLAATGFVVGSVESVFSLTQEGEVEAGGAVAGRKAVVNLFLASGCSLSVHDIVVAMGAKSDASTKRVVRRLMTEGMLEYDEGRQKGDGTKSRRLYRLTEQGRRVGSAYAPQPTLRGWLKLTPGRWAMLEVMCQANEPMVASEIAKCSRTSIPAVKAFMRESESKGYVESTVVSEGPLTYGFTLTTDGRQAMLDYKTTYGIPRAVESTKKADSTGRLEAGASGSVVEEPRLFAEPTALTAVYRVDVRRASVEAAELIAALSRLDGVNVELLRQVG